MKTQLFWIIVLFAGLQACEENDDTSKDPIIDGFNEKWVGNYSSNRVCSDIDMFGNITRDTTQVNGRIIEFYRDSLEDFIHVVVQVDTTHEQEFYNYAEVFENDTISLITLEGPLYWALTFF